MTFDRFTPADFAERDRRWENIRVSMKAQGLDAILIVSDGHFERRADFRYVTNCVDHANELWHYCVFPAEGRPVALNCNDGWMEDECRRSVPFRGAWVPESELYAKYIVEIIKELDLGKAKIGIENDVIPWHVYRNLVKRLPEAQLVDSRVVRPLMNIKSPYEIEQIYKGAAMLDCGFQACLDHARPGMTWNQVTSHVTEAIFGAGAEEIGGFPLSRSVETIGEGDTYIYYPEMQGAGGFWIQCGRLVSFGEPSKELHEDWELNIEAQRAAAELLRPGRTGGDIWHAIEKVLRGSRYEIAHRSSGHGMGLGIPERPFLSADDQTQIAPNMLVVIHPAVSPKHPKFQGNAESYLTTSGAPIKLSKISPEIRVIK